MDGKELRALQAIDRGRLLSPRSPEVQTLLSRGVLTAGRDGYVITPLGRDILDGRDPEALTLHGRLLSAISLILSAGCTAIFLCDLFDWSPVVIVVATLLGVIAAVLADLRLRRRARSPAAEPAA